MSSILTQTKTDSMYMCMFCILVLDLNESISRLIKDLNRTYMYCMDCYLIAMATHRIPITSGISSLIAID